MVSVGGPAPAPCPLPSLLKAAQRAQTVVRNRPQVNETPRPAEHEHQTGNERIGEQARFAGGSRVPAKPVGSARRYVSPTYGRTPNTLFNHSLALDRGPSGRAAPCGHERGAAVKELQVDAKVGLSEPAVDQLPIVSHVRLTRDDIGMLSVKAELTNTLAKPLSGFSKAYAVIRDADGRIIAGDYTFPHDDLAPGAKRALSFDLLSDVPGAASADVTVENEGGN